MNHLHTVLVTIYGVSPLSASVESVLWASERVARQYGYAMAGESLRQLNTERAEAGKIPAYPEYGSALWDGWAAAVDAAAAARQAGGVIPREDLS